VLVPPHCDPPAVKWWFPARLFGIHHESHVFAGMTEAEIREWKRQQQLR
jgi:hypothetical protein